MSGTRRDRTVRAAWTIRAVRTLRTALTRALTAACVVLLCVFGAGPAAAMAADHRPASGAPLEPVEGQSDPAAEPETRAAVRTFARWSPGVRQLPLRTFHVKHGARPPSAHGSETSGPALPSRAARGVVLRC
ncbi:hypothetical protein [Streptomyces sp. NPDC002990]